MTPDQIVNGPIAEFAKYGLLGAIVILLGWYSYSVGNKLSACYADRLSDWKTIADALRDIGLVLAKWTSANEVSTRAAEASVRATELAAAAQVGLKEEVASLRSELANLREAHQKTGERVQSLREAFLQKGVAV